MRPNPIPPPPKPEFPTEQEDKVEIARIDQLLAEGAFLVKKPRKAMRNPLVIVARNVFRRGFVSKHIVQAPWNEGCLDIRVSRASLSRAIRIIAGIIDVLEANGIRVKVMPRRQSYRDRSSETSATIFGEQVQFGITEKTRQLRVPDPKATPDALGRRRSMTLYEATGVLSIQVFSGSKYFTTDWHDTDQTEIESLIPECVASMMKIAVEYRRNAARRNQEALFQRLRWEELRRLQKQIEAEEARIQRLEKRASDWQRARRIREYVLAFIEHQKKQRKELSPQTALGRWAVWALQQAERIDPLGENPASVLDRKWELEGWSPYGWR
jgi:hypothetical protein